MHGRHVASARTRIARRNKINRIALPTKGQRFTYRVLRCHIKGTRVPFKIFRIGQIGFVQRNKEAGLADGNFLFRIIGNSVAPSIAIGISRGNIRTHGTVGRFNGMIIQFSLNNMQIPLGARQNSRLFTRLVPIGFQMDNSINIVIASHTISFTRSLRLIGLTMLTLRAMNSIYRLFASN